MISRNNQMKSLGEKSGGHKNLENLGTGKFGDGKFGDTLKILLKANLPSLKGGVRTVFEVWGTR